MLVVYEEREIVALDGETVYNAHRGLDQVKDAYNDIGSVIAAAQNVLSSAPACIDNEVAKKHWESIQTTCINAIKTHQEKVKRILEAVMKFKVVDNSCTKISNAITDEDNLKNIEILELKEYEINGTLQLVNEGAQLIIEAIGEDYLDQLGKDLEILSHNVPGADSILQLIKDQNALDT